MNNACYKKMSEVLQIGYMRRRAISPAKPGRMLPWIIMILANVYWGWENFALQHLRRRCGRGIRPDSSQPEAKIPRRPLARGGYVTSL
jgi:hypothetical protein